LAVSTDERSQQSLYESILKRIPDSVRKQTGDDIEKIIAYYTQHAEHLHINAKGEYDINP
jgi:hypothetical protein